MFCLVGLGNPGQKYQSTRHNAGFLVVDEIINRLNATTKNAHQSLLAKTKYNGKDLLLIKPQTFMNCSGQAVLEVVNYYKITQRNILVIYDDMDLKLGSIRMRLAGSSGGHRGLSSIIEILNTTEFSRLRLGIDRPTDGRTIVDYVLTRVSEDEQSKFNRGIVRAAEAALDFVLYGPNYVMNHYNADEVI